MRRIAYVKDSAGTAIGSRTRAKVVKNKVAPPFRTAEFDIMYNEGISLEGTLLDLGVTAGLIEKKGSFLSYEGASLGRGREQARAFLKGDKKLASKIAREIKAKLSPAAG